MNRSIVIISILCSLLLLYPVKKGYTYGPMDINQPRKLTEAYDPQLYIRLQSIQSLTNYISDTYKGNKNTFEFVDYIGMVISKRFYHGYSYYSENDNWVASMAGNFVWKDLSAIVVPDDIMKHPVAACSQQSIVMMECARAFGFDTRKVTFDHHFTTEVKVGSKWFYVDPNMEVSSGSRSLEELIQSKQFALLYEKKLGVKETKNIFSNPTYGKSNEEVAKKARIFQKMTSWISIYFICILFFIQAVIFFYHLQKEKLDYPKSRLQVLKSFMP